MRPIVCLGLLIALPFVVHAQEAPPGTAVERVTMSPGQTASFTLAPGKDHQLLNAADPGTKGAITITYSEAGGRATISAVSKTGYTTKFTVLADPDGDGGFEAAGEIALPGDGTAAAKSWPAPLGKVNVGDFLGGPHGMEDHQPSGEAPATPQ